MTHRLTRTLPFVVALATFSLHFAQAQYPSAPAPSGPFEAFPTLSAAAILRPEFLEGPNFKVRDETDALFCQQSAQLMAKVNKTTPVRRITELNGLPVCQTNDGTVIVPIQWDYVVWTPMAARFAAALKAGKFATPATGSLVSLSGVVSPMSATAMTDLGIKFAEKQLPGPLK